MEKYNKLLSNIAELIEKGLFNSKDLKKEVENTLKLKEVRKEETKKITESSKAITRSRPFNIPEAYTKVC